MFYEDSHLLYALHSLDFLALLMMSMKCKQCIFTEFVIDHSIKPLLTILYTKHQFLDYDTKNIQWGMKPCLCASDTYFHSISSPAISYRYKSIHSMQDFARL